MSADSFQSVPYVALISISTLRAGISLDCTSKVRVTRRASETVPPGQIERICSAVDLAAIWYWTAVLCLQRSAATVCLLRQRGVEAHMIIGVQRLPFKAHAWVEVEGRVVNDKPYMQEMYAVLDRC